MRHLPSRLRRLDDALADLPLDDPMLLSELDGFLTGLALSPEPIMPGEWLTVIWGSDEGGIPPFEDPLDTQWFADAVLARYHEVVRDLGRGKPQPLFDIDDRNGDVLWEDWAEGFAEAMALRPESWAALAEGEDRDAAEALARMTMLIAVARNESMLDSMEINAMQERVPAELIESVVRLHAARSRIGGALPAPSIGARSAKVGRNEPCPCGSGKKSKRCCA